jgi:CheY-like chemotaxis protein
MAPNVLVVEDEPDMADIITNYLRSLGCNVAGWAKTGAEAVRLAGATHPDMVLMDIMLQGREDGIRAARQILEKHGIHVIYLTALSDEKTLNLAEETKPHGYLVKPFSKEELAVVLKSATQILVYGRQLRSTGVNDDRLERYRKAVLSNHYEAIPLKKELGADELVKGILAKEKKAKKGP